MRKNHYSATSRCAHSMSDLELLRPLGLNCRLPSAIGRRTCCRGSPVLRPGTMRSSVWRKSGKLAVSSSRKLDEESLRWSQCEPIQGANLLSGILEIDRTRCSFPQDVTAGHSECPHSAVGANQNRASIDLLFMIANSSMAINTMRDDCCNPVADLGCSVSVSFDRRSLSLQSTIAAKRGQSLALLRQDTTCPASSG